MIKNLLIDFGGVLIDLQKEVCLAEFRRLGVEGMDALLEDCHQKGFLMDFELGNLSAEAFCNQVRLLGTGTPDNATITAAWNSFLIGIPHYKLQQLLELRKTYRTILLSNTNELHWAWTLQHDFSWDGHTLFDFFDEAFLSFKRHKAKPAPDFFQEVIAETSILPAETLFIDDSPANCRTAQALGFRTFTPTPRMDWVKELFPL
jgi:putative hydrolase of the HAD superfamily